MTGQWNYFIHKDGRAKAPQQSGLIRPYYHCICGETLLENKQ